MMLDDARVVLARHCTGNTQARLILQALSLRPSPDLSSSQGLRVCGTGT